VTVLDVIVAAGFLAATVLFVAVAVLSLRRDETPDGPVLLVGGC
jgi:hypothetical protein